MGSALSLPCLVAIRNRKAALAKANCKPESQATQLLIDLDSYRKQRLGGRAGTLLCSQMDFSSTCVASLELET